MDKFNELPFQCGAHLASQHPRRTGHWVEEAQPSHLLPGDCLWREWPEKKTAWSRILPYVLMKADTAQASLFLTLSNQHLTLSWVSKLIFETLLFTVFLFCSLLFISLAKGRKQVTVRKFKFTVPYILEASLQQLPGITPGSKPIRFRWSPSGHCTLTDKE